MSRGSLFIQFFCGLLLLLAQGLPVQAEVDCGATISEEVTLTKDLSCDTPTALTVVGPGGQLNLGGHTISCNDRKNANGIFLVGENGRVTNGTVTNCHLGVVAGDNGQHHILGIISRDHSLAGLTTGAFGTLAGSNGNWFINNHTENSPNGFLITGNENYVFNNSSVASERGFVVSQNRNTFTLNIATHNDIGFAIQLGAEENHFIKNVAEENAFAGFEIEGNRNRLVNNRATGNGRSMIDVGFRIVDANDNFLGWNLSEKNTGIGFEILGLFTRLTSLAGAGFLAMIIATQWPGAAGAIPAHYQIVEMTGMLVLAAVGAGRFAGLDFLLHALRVRCFPPKTERT